MFVRTKVTRSSLFILIFIVLACNKKFKYTVEKNDNSVTIYKDSLVISIEVIDHAIIHVQKSIKGQKKSNIPNYVTILEPKNINWNLKQSEEKVSIITDDLTVTVDNEGIIKYYKKDDENLVNETNELTYIDFDASNENTVSQAFIAGDEGLYGLGQFQSGIMNWKHVPIRLQQYNQEIAVPFLVSTKGYGIYWHNYSLTDFNKSQNEIPFKSKESVQIKKDENVIVTHGEKEDVAAYVTKKVAHKNRRETTFTPTKTGEYTFMVLSDDDGRMRGEIKLIINDDEIINYSTIWMPRRYSGKKHLEAGKTYKVVFQNTRASMPGKVFYNEPDYNKTVFSSTKGNSIDYYLVHGENPEEVILQYQNLTGKAPMFPKSAYGFWQCRERYHNQEELLENAQEMRKRKIPFDNIVQDWFYWPEGTKGPEWDRVKYPNPKGMVDSLKKLNLKLMVSVWPEVNNDSLEKKYGIEKIKSSNYIDVYNPKIGKRFYRMLSDSMFHVGVNSIWLDGTEPEGVKDVKVNTHVGSYEEVQNPYSLEVTKVMYEERRKEFPEERVFNLTRSAYAGQQRYGATSWSGDVEASWEQLSEQIAAGLNFTMTGIPYWSHDIGGFFRDRKSINRTFDNQYTNPEYIELLTRWFQFGTFSPIFRIHGYKSKTEIWRYGPEFENMARKFIDIRYQLMPYIYSEAWKVTSKSKLLMSPLAYYYPNDKNTWGIKDQFFFGESIMVGVVTDYQQRNKKIYLPEGTWFNYWTNEKVTGSKEVLVNAPLNETPIFIKAGSIIPMGPKIQYSTEPTDKPARIKIYPGKDSKYVLYMDDNESYDYEKGLYSELIIEYIDAKKEVKLTKGNGNYLNYKEKPINLIVELIGTQNKMPIVFNGENLEIQLN